MSCCCIWAVVNVAAWNLICCYQFWWITQHPLLFSLLVCCSATPVVVISNEESGLWVKWGVGGEEESCYRIYPRNTHDLTMCLLSIGFMPVTTHIILFFLWLLLLLTGFPHCCCYCIWPLISTFSWSSYHGHDSLPPFFFPFFSSGFFLGVVVVVVVVVPLLLVLPNKGRILCSESL